MCCWLCNLNTCLLVLQLLLLIALQEAVFVVAWLVAIPPPSVRYHVVSTSSSTRLWVETVSLKELTDHEKEGTLLAESITRWLDHEVRAK
jgi:hypothetical protein